MDMPEGFKYDAKRNMVVYTYSTKLTKGNMKKLKEERLETLLKWCENLPNQNMEN
jgi:hypothetical protein